ncbi:MAG: ketoacyl-ACP synthase III [Phycisphaerales bacterium]|nr:ketoacyl-ACP synthase III [Phycisphaerales bacterium]
MKVEWPVEIGGTGMCVPPRVVTNDELSKVVDTSHDWIVQRTGIHERRWVQPGETTLSLAAAASRAALAQANLAPEDIDQIVIATATPELPLPATACLLQAELGCRWIPAFDIAAACSGFVWALLQGAQSIVTGVARNVLVVGAETLSNITDRQDRATCILFGDAAGAAVLRPSTTPGRGIYAVEWGADGTRAEMIHIPAGGARQPATQATVEERLHFMHMQGREVYKFAVTQMQAVIMDACRSAGITPADLKLAIPHQSNLRIIESACERCGLPMDRVLVNIQRYGNTSAASVAVALHEARQAGRIEPGDWVLLLAFGAGLTWGAVLVRA